MENQETTKEQQENNEGVVFEAVDTAQKTVTEVRAEGNFSPSEQVSAAVTNAEIMLAYITEHGINISKEHVNNVVHSKYLLQNKQWSPEAEVDLRLTYNELTKLIAPVTIDSLIASKPMPRKNPGKICRALNIQNHMPLSQWSVTVYTFLSLFIMAILLLVQIYFFLGSTRMNHIQECNQKIAEKQSRLNELMLVLNNGADDSALALENEQLQNEMIELDNEKTSNIQHLIPWVDYLQNLVTLSPKKKQAREEAALNAAQEGVAANTDTIQQAQSYLVIIGIYLLPLLYGIMGGLSFVLREITSEVRSLTFSRVTNTKYLLRIVLASLAGLSIGLFWGDLEKTQQFGIASLSPMLLAFLAGYCVEYLFMFIEKVVTSFVKKYGEDTK